MDEQTRQANESAAEAIRQMLQVMGLRGEGQAGIVEREGRRVLEIEIENPFSYPAVRAHAESLMRTDPMTCLTLHSIANLLWMELPEALRSEWSYGNFVSQARAWSEIYDLCRELGIGGMALEGGGVDQVKEFMRRLHVAATAGESFSPGGLP